METLSGLATSHGLVAGPVFVYGGEEDVPVPEYSVAPEACLQELARFHAARAETRRQIEAMAESLRQRTDGPAAEIFDNHLLLFDDPSIVSGIERRIRDEHLNAEAAVRKTCAAFRAVFAKMKDAYLRERIRDVDDLERRILMVLMGRDANPFSAITSPVIVVAPDLTPSETVTLPRELILGFVTDRGSTTSHVALLARARGIPAVTGVGRVSSRVRAGDRLLLDGTHGTVTLNPDAAVADEFDRQARRERELCEILAEDLSTGGSLGLRFCANAQPGVPFGGLASCGAQGIGLYRSEYLWLADDVTPDEATQTRVYEQAARAGVALGSGARTVFRVLDIGGDKIVRGFKSPESNPFLGNRSIRWLLSHRNVFRTQLRAILRASAAGPSAVMFPMVATCAELRAAKEELARAKASLRAENVPFDDALPCGCMIEIPAAALNAAAFAREVDFFSIGTNDLVQYTLAADRGNEQVSYLYQPANPAVLKLVDMTVRAAKAAGIPVAVCGESASDPVLGVLWAALGVDELSMSPSYIPVLRKTFQGLVRGDLDALAAAVRARLDSSDAAEMYAFCRQFLLDRVPHLAELESFFTTSQVGG